jgi:hypothetical protein
MLGGHKVFFKILDANKAWATTRHFLTFFIQKRPSGHKAFSTILDLQNAWQLLSVLYDFGSKKCLMTAKHFLQFWIRKMPSNY